MNLSSLEPRFKSTIRNEFESLTFSLLGRTGDSKVRREQAVGRRTPRILDTDQEFMFVFGAHPRDRICQRSLRSFAVGLEIVADEFGRLNQGFPKRFSECGGVSDAYDRTLGA